ncbi:putative E3 ubiquitin-protein ligase ariadne-2, partial [Fragariocoptes setiger]
MLDEAIYEGKEGNEGDDDDDGDDDEDIDDIEYYYNNNEHDDQYFTDQYKLSHASPQHNSNRTERHHSSNIMAENSKSGVTDDDPEHFEYQCLNLDQVSHLLDTAIDCVCDALAGKCTRPTARYLLKANSWNADKAIQAYEHRQKVGLPMRQASYNVMWIQRTPNHAKPETNTPKLLEHFAATNNSWKWSGRRDIEIQASHNSFEMLSCEICFDHSPTCLISLNCDHKYCIDCWTRHVSVQLEQGITSSIECMSLDCDEPMPEEMILELIVSATHSLPKTITTNMISNSMPTLVQRYKRLALQDAIGAHPRLRWCPGADCSIVIHALQANVYTLNYYLTLNESPSVNHPLLADSSTLSGNEWQSFPSVSSTPCTPNSNPTNQPITQHQRQQQQQQQSNQSGSRRWWSHHRPSVLGHNKRRSLLDYVAGSSSKSPSSKKTNCIVTTTTTTTTTTGALIPQSTPSDRRADAYLGTSSDDNSKSLVNASKKVKCSACSTIFCFGCGLAYHAPADCLTIKKWLAKCEDDSETLNYIAVHTKDCPKCNVSIEKNGGCNHMQCYACRYNFCWICLGDWKTHGTQYYECSRYRGPRDDINATDISPDASSHASVSSGTSSVSSSAQLSNVLPGGSKQALTSAQISQLLHQPTTKSNNVGNRRDAASAREQLTKYLFYYERYDNHARSLRLEAQTTTKIKERILEYVHANKGTWIDWQYLLDAADLLAACRYTLQYTYPYAYYSEPGPRKQLFEYQQAQLEAEIENLSWKLERAESHKRGDIESQMCVAERRRRTLLKEFQPTISANSL